MISATTSSSITIVSSKDEKININSSKTLEKAKCAFKELTQDLEKIPFLNSLPQNLKKVSCLKSSIGTTEKHWLETSNPKLEGERIFEPNPNAIYRACYLALVQDNREKSIFSKKDLQILNQANEKRERTYFWFKWGNVPLAILSFLQGFTPYIFPSKEPRDNGSVVQGLIIGVSATIIAALGILYTGLYPDNSQDGMNDKIGRIAKVGKKLDEVARTLILLAFHKNAAVRQFAYTASCEINLNKIKELDFRAYGIEKADIDGILIALTQAIHYINHRELPTHTDLKLLIQSLNKRKQEYLEKGEWES